MKEFALSCTGADVCNVFCKGIWSFVVLFGGGLGPKKPLSPPKKQRALFSVLEPKLPG
jgi:hypothetical protein